MTSPILRLTRAALAALAALAAAACSPFTVDADYDETADFASYRTYAWMPAPDPADDPVLQDELTTRRIRAAVDAHLPARGLTQAAPEDADLMLQHHVAVRERVEVWDDYGYRYGPGWRRSTLDVHTYSEGTLLLDFVDAKTDRLVWRGSATAAVSRNRSANAEKIDGAVRAILERYPPAR